MIPSITGVGLVSPLGRSAGSTFDALLEGRFITVHSRLESDARFDLPCAVALAIEATDEAIAQAGWTSGRDDVAVIACTSKGSIESWIRGGGGLQVAGWGLKTLPQRTTSNLPPTSSLSFGLSDLSNHVARHIGSTGAPRLCLSSACASGLHGLIRGAMMIQSGEANRVLVVAAEASVHPLFLASFDRLGVLPKAAGLCRPFDQHRDGFLMSEAAAAVCLEAADDSSRILIERFALGGDATHLTGSDPHGAVLRHLLQNVMRNDRFDLIHAHGTGTISNDSIELAALEQTSSDAVLFSHKAALGHSLGASGLVAAVISCLCHQTGQVPGNINTAHPLPSPHLRIEQGSIARPIHRSLIHAAGFGGSTAVVSLVS